MGISSTPLPISVNRLGQVDIPQDRLDVKKQWVQLRMFLVVNFFDILKLRFFLLCVCYICPSARYGGYTLSMVTADSIWKSFPKYE